VRYAIFPAGLLVLCCSTLATPVKASTVPPQAKHPARIAPAASALYARRSRRLVQSYLRLKLLEMREADLERARLVIERKLGIGALLRETPPPIAR
jgi:hypothetical protein